VGRGTLTLLGIAAVAVAAIFIAKGMLRPAKEEVERLAPVLTGQYAPQLQECVLLEDSQLPEGLAPPKVDEDLRYVQVEILYPGVEKTPPPADHLLERVNGGGGAPLEPVWNDTDVTEDGAYVYLIYKATTSFEYARLTRRGEVVLERIDLQ
jgi:hypothetical protein